MAAADCTISPFRDMQTGRFLPNGPSTRKDYTNVRFGRLVVDAMLWAPYQTTHAWCRCDCGGSKRIAMSSLLAGTASCGCLHKERVHLALRRDLTGQPFGLLVVQATWWEAGERYVTALCACGGQWKGRGEYLTSGDTTSCGCKKITRPERRKSLAHKKAVQKAFHQRRRAQKKQLPYQFAKHNFDFMMTYWQESCAVCACESHGLFHTLALDHWIPLAHPSCLGTTPWNMVPLCHVIPGGAGVFSVGGCNNTKLARVPETWLVERLGIRQARKKLQEVETFFQAARAFEAAYQQCQTR